MLVTTTDPSTPGTETDLGLKADHVETSCQRSGKLTGRKAPTKIAIHPDESLLVTSAREGASDQQLAAQPLTGSIVKIPIE